MRLLPCSLAAIAGIFSMVALAGDLQTAPATPLQLAASQIEWCPPTTDGGTGRGDYFDPAKYRCVAGHILTPDDDYCPPGSDGKKAKGGKFKPANYRCEHGYLLNKEQQYCAPGSLGDGGDYKPAFARCLDGYLLGPGDDYCYRGAKGPGGTYKVAQQLCDDGKILGITLQIGKITGAVSLIGKDGKPRPLTAGDGVREGDTVTTGADGRVQLGNPALGLATLKPDSIATIEKARYSPDCRAADECSTVLELGKGGLRWITAKIRKLAPLELQTVSGYTGIRGTDYSAYQVPTGPHDNSLEPGTYTRVREGAIVMRNEGGSLEVQAGQSAYMQSIGKRPVLLEKSPAIFADETYWRQ